MTKPVNRRVAAILLAGVCALAALIALRMGDSLGSGEAIGPDPMGSSDDAGSDGARDDATADLDQPFPLPDATKGGGRTESLTNPVAPPPEVQHGPPARLVARVVDAKGTAIPNAHVELRSAGKATALPVSKQGRVESTFVDLGTGDTLPIQLAVEAEGYGSRLVGASVQSGRECSLGNVVLQVEAAIVGVVTDEAGSPLPGASVYVQFVPVGTDPSVGFPLAAEVNRALGSHLRHTVPKDTPLAITDPKGAYAFHGLGEGSVRLWAALPGKLAAYSGEMGLHSGFRTNVPDLVLGQLEPERVIRGRILDPDGAPVAGARANLLETVWYPWSGAFSAEDGTFVLPVIAGEIYDLIGDDPQGRWGAVETPAIPAGSRGIVLRLRSCEPSSIVVTDEQGAPIPYYGFSVAAADRSGREKRFAAEVRSAEVRCPILPTAFNLWVFAPGYQGESIGPLEPAALPRSIEVALKRKANLYGTVTFGGQPVAGATVEARPLLESAGVASHRLGYRQPFVLPTQAVSSGRETVTDASGRYYLGAVEGKTYALRAQVDRQGPLVERTVEVAGDGPAFDLELQPLGSVLGKVVDRAGEPQAGCTVAATAGFGHVAFVQADSQGDFLFDRLGPGRHWLAVLKGSQPPGASSGNSPAAAAGTFAMGGPPGQAEQLTVEVAAGAAADVLITVDEKRAVEVTGQLSVVAADGRSVPVEGWRVEAAPLDDAGAFPHSTILGQDGGFELMLDSGSKHWLTVEGTLQGQAIQLTSELRPAGDQLRWEEGVFLGTLKGTMGAGIVLSPLRELGAVVRLDSGTRAYVPISLRTGRVLGPLALPAGSVSIVELRTGPEDPGERIARVFKKLFLAPGSTEEVVVD